MQSVLGLFYFASNMGNLPFQFRLINNSVCNWLIKYLGTKEMNGANIFRKWLFDSVSAWNFSDKKAETFDMLQHFCDAKDRDGNRVDFKTAMGEAANVLGAGIESQFAR
jgi:hypothetical protein